MSELSNVDYLENLYFQYLADPKNIPLEWKHYFQKIDNLPIFSKEGSSGVTNVIDDVGLKAYRLVEAYRSFGHLKVKVNPISLNPIHEPNELNLDLLGFDLHQLTITVPSFGLFNTPTCTLAELIHQLNHLYGNHIGFEFRDLQYSSMEQWLQNVIEQEFYQKTLCSDEKKYVLDYLNKSELFETFLHTKFVGQKRFSLEGCETLIPMLGLCLEAAAEMDVEEVVLGMAHRGRLNVLTNILTKTHEEVFLEFDEHYIPESFEEMGDVKYHKGYQGDYVKTQTNKRIKLTLCPNPSHLESVNAVVEGVVRAKQMHGHTQTVDRMIPILIHGDAAISGQGVVYETLQMSHLKGYETGGTLHIIINNQIGFTTLPRDSRSTTYCTDIAKTFGCPVFHVNAEDPDSCAQVMLLALKIRQQFHSDVFIELNGYRKYGHNESDEPAYTQPLEYQLIRKKRTIRELYHDQLLEEGILDKAIIDQMEDQFKIGLQQALAKIKGNPSDKRSRGLRAVGTTEPLFSRFDSTVDKATLIEVAECFSRIPDGFALHPKLQQLIKDRLSMVNGDKPIDWGMGELLALGTLLWQGVNVRLSGQDSCRGTFSHRHALWVDQESEREYFPLAHLKENQGRFEVYNSPLSEMAVLGFEYGYSLATLGSLVIWEAQFGDFCNGAQVIIDQYIASGEQKWGQKSGLVLFLPHGYEGQGPEHSSGRLERFLALAGHDNIQIVYPTTPAQFFHLLRKQGLGKQVKPMIIFTPKGLLRYPPCISTIKDFAEGAFQSVIDDPLNLKSAVELVFCTGRIYYDLIKEREIRKDMSIACVRIEQLYPLNKEKITEVLKSYPHVNKYLWVQEEPENMGAWSYIVHLLQPLLPTEFKLEYVGRQRSATPATGSHYRHEVELSTIIKQVFES